MNIGKFFYCFSRDLEVINIYCVYLENLKIYCKSYWVYYYVNCWNKYILMKTVWVWIAEINFNKALSGEVRMQFVAAHKSIFMSLKYLVEMLTLCAWLNFIYYGREFLMSSKARFSVFYKILNRVKKCGFKENLEKFSSS